MIALRNTVPADAGAIAAIYAPHVLTGTVSFEVDPPDARAMRARMVASDGLYPWIVATTGEEEGGVLGYAYATRFRDRPAYAHVVETSVYVAAAVQRQGTGRLLYQVLIDTLRTQGFTQAMSGIALPNDASIALHESVGFRRAGVFRSVGFKHGQWIDVGFWQRELAPPTVPAPEIRRFADVGIVRI